MTRQTTRVSIEEFDRLVLKPANAERRLETIGGNSRGSINSYASAVAVQISFLIILHMREQDIKRTITGADGGYQIAGERYIPDVAFISQTRPPQPSHEAYNPTPPDLAVEVLSPTDDPAHLRFKLTNYLAAGNTARVVDPDAQQVEIHTPGQPAQRFGVNDKFTGGDVLPRFAIQVKAIFP